MSNTAIRKQREDVINKKNIIKQIIKNMEEKNEKISFYSVSKKANCARTFLYNDTELRELINSRRRLSLNMVNNLPNKQEIDHKIFIAIYDCFNKIFLERLVEFAKEHKFVIGGNYEYYDRNIVARIDMNSCFNIAIIYCMIGGTEWYFITGYEYLDGHKDKEIVLLRTPEEKEVFSFLEDKINANNYIKF